jgi:hypothetical protein
MGKYDETRQQAHAASQTIATAKEIAAEPKHNSVGNTRKGRQRGKVPVNEHDAVKKQSSMSNMASETGPGSEEIRNHFKSLEDLEAGNPQSEEHKYYEEEIEDLPVVPPGDNEIIWGYYGHRRRRPTARLREDWVLEMDEIESAIGSASGTRYYRTNQGQDCQDQEGKQVAGDDFPFLV